MSDTGYACQLCDSTDCKRQIIDADDHVGCPRCDACDTVRDCNERVKERRSRAQAAEARATTAERERDEIATLLSAADLHAERAVTAVLVADLAVALGPGSPLDWKILIEVVRALDAKRKFLSEIAVTLKDERDTARRSLDCDNSGDACGGDPHGFPACAKHRHAKTERDLAAERARADTYTSEWATVAEIVGCEPGGIGGAVSVALDAAESAVRLAMLTGRACVVEVVKRAEEVDNCICAGEDRPCDWCIANQGKNR